MPHEMVKPNKVSLQEIPYGVPGTKVTIEAIVEESKKGSTDWDVISIARKLTHESAPRDNLHMANTLFWWVKNNIKFVRDPYTAELVQSAAITVKTGYGDCDDMCTSLAAMLLGLGIPVRFVTVAAEKGNPNYSHILLQAQTQNGWVSYDPATPGSFPGWFPPDYHRLAVWDIDGGYQELSGWFSKTWKRIKKEIKRAIRRIKAEIDRVERRIAKELNRWKEKHGFLGHFLNVLVKGVVLLTPIGWVSQFEEDSPFKMTSEEWKFLAKLGSVIGSGILTVITGGSTAALLVSSAVSVANAATSAVEVHDQLKKRKKILKQLKAQKARVALEKRAQREAINKLQADIEVMEMLLTKQKEAEFELALYQKKLKEDLEREKVAQKEGFEAEISRYKGEIKAATERWAVDFARKAMYEYVEKAGLSPEEFRQQLEYKREIEQRRARADHSIAFQETRENIEVPIPVDTHRQSSPWQGLVDQKKFVLYT